MGQTKSMSYVSKAEDLSARWRPQHALDSAQLPAPLHTLLVETGSLTEKLRANCDDSFSVQVLRQCHCHAGDYPEHALAPGPGGALLREVYLKCDGRPVVFAQTLCPDATLAAHPWLAELGERPLGQELFAQPDVTRLPFEFAALGKHHPLAVRALSGLESDTAAAQLWARRSCFLLGGDAVSVNEVFFHRASTIGV